MTEREYAFGDELNSALEREQLREALREAHRKLAKARSKEEALTEAAYEGAMAAVQAFGPPKGIIVPKPRSGRGRPEAALWHMTDWQGAKVTTSYNTDVMYQRVQKFTERAADITNIQRKDHPVDTCYVVFGGDMIEGLFNFPTQPYEIDSTLFEQFVNVARLIERTLYRAAAIYKKVHVVPEWGNHGRLGSKRAAVPRSDNADRMTYRLAESMTSNEKRITWQQCPDDIQRLEIGNYRALVVHGDEIGRNGFASPMTIVNHANRWRSGAYPWEFRDLYIGHYHSHNDWSMANGEGMVFQTGSTESDNRYARDTMAASAIPSQRLHFIDPQKGRVTAQYKITVD